MSTTRNVVLRFLTSGDKQVSTAMARIQSQRDKLTSTDVNLTIKADDKDALAKLDETLRKAQETGARKINIKIGADAKDADATLAAVRAKADELGLKKVNIKVSTDGAGKTTIGLAAIATEVAGLNTEGNKSPSMFANFARSAENAATSLDKIVPGLGALVPTGGVGGLFAIPVLAAGIGAIATEATALGAGLAAAGTGAGAFALLAAPAVKSVETNYQALNTAMVNYNKAVQLQKDDPTVAHAKAVKAALDQVNLAGEAIQKLPDQEQGAIDGIYKLTQTFQAMSKAFEPEAFKVFNAALGVANSLLPHVTPFAQTFADSVTILLGKLKGFTASKGFSDWLNQFHSLEGPAIGAIGAGVGKLATAFGQLIVKMPSADIVNAINIGFGIMTALVKTLTGIVGFSLVAFESYKRTIVDIWHVGFNSFRALSVAWFAAWHYMDNVFHQVMTNVHNWWFDSWHAMYDTFKEVTTNIHNWWFDTWHAIYNFYMPIQNAIVSAATTAWNAVYKVISGVWYNFVKPILTIWLDYNEIIFTAIAVAAERIWNTISTSFEMMWNNAIKPVLSGIVSFFRAELGLIGAIATGVWKGISTAFTVMWNDVLLPQIQQVGRVFAGVWNGIYNTVASVWKHIGDTGNSASNNVIKPTVSGIGNFFSTIWHGIEHIASVVWNAVANSFVWAWNFILKPAINFLWSTISNIFGAIVHAAAIAFGWIPSLGGKLRNAATQFTQFKDNVNASLNGLNNKTLNVAVDFKSAGIGGIPSGVRAPGFAGGGTVRGAGGPKADRIPAMLSDGEYVHQASAVSRYGVPAMHAVNQGKAVIHYANGGPVGFQGFAGGGGVSVHASTPSSASINSLTLGALQNLANSFAKSFVSSLTSYSSTPGGFTGGGAGQWIGLVLQALAMEGLPSSLLGQVLVQINSESGGNPNAINLTDSNAAMGDPSRGLLQTIGSTFAAYHWPGTSNNIYDPLANIAAAINYARHVYGPTLMSGGMGIGSGHGYAFGTNSAARGWAMVGEHGPEAVNFRGGERVVPNNRLGGNTYYITIEVPPTAHPADTGREVVKVIKAYEQRSGSGWRS